MNRRLARYSVWREAFNKHIGIKATAMLHIVQPGPKVTHGVGHLRHVGAKFFMSGIVHLRSLRHKPVIICGPLLHGPLYGSQTLLSGTVILFKQLDTDIPASGLKGGHAG